MACRRLSRSTFARLYDSRIPKEKCIHVGDSDIMNAINHTDANSDGGTYDSGLRRLEVNEVVEHVRGCS